MTVESFGPHTKSMGSVSTTGDAAGIEAVTNAWEHALANHDVEALLACYAPDATLESPVAAGITGPGAWCILTGGDHDGFTVHVLAKARN